MNKESNITWVFALIQILLGLLFIFSGVVKLIPIEPFEYKFVELGVANWLVAPFMARLLIALEIFLGVMLIVHIKPVTILRATLILLLLFTIYLVYDIVRNGNDGNCGCFGSFIIMTPLESIIKNAGMILVTILLLKTRELEVTWKPLLITILLAVASIATPFILYPVDPYTSEQANAEETGYVFPKELLGDFRINNQPVDLAKGEYIVAFMSLNCEHCKKAAYKLYILDQKMELPPVYLVFIGLDYMVPAFVKETKADFPYYLYNEDNFFKIAGSSVPRIFYIRDGIVKGKFDNLTFSDQALKDAMKK